ncbi:hypothetical protein Leryth_002374 [Lithospermum erythrorhizon]|nr:hypothetical protein Leryth_002374 [Lithospermum erythrorhizon]
MGNHISSKLSSGKHAKSSKVIFPSGEIIQYKQPTNAAELMFESPNFFLANAKSLQIGSSDMGGLFLAAKSAACRKRVSFGITRISPECNNEDAEESKMESTKLNVDEVLEEYAAAEMQKRRLVSRSKKPLLETIIEEPSFSR